MGGYMPPKNTHGGKRQGAGRPKQVKTVSQKTKKAILKAARQLAKEYGEPIEKAMLRMVYEKDVQDTVKASVFKTYLDALVAKESESNVNITDNRGPAIGLPPKREDPALTIVEGGK